MLFILRQLRRLELRKRSGQYFIYAFGEIVLIVAGILIALQISEWNEGRRDSRDRQVLIGKLIQDFQTTKERIEQGREVAAAILKYGDFLLLSDPKDESIPLERWNEAAVQVWEKVEFEPVSATYQSAVDTGSIGLLENSELLEVFAEFKQLNDNYELHDRYSAEVFYRGANWDAAKEIGSVRLLWASPDEYPVRPERSQLDIREIYSRPTVVAAVELYWQAIFNIDGSLQRMDEVVDRILRELNQLQHD